MNGGESSYKKGSFDERKLCIKEFNMSKQFINKIETYIPDLKRYLNEGASNKEIMRLEKETGYNFPDSFKALYSIHNGEKSNLGLFFGFHWLSIHDILDHWNNNRKCHDNLLSNGVISIEKEKIKEEYFYPGWVPIAYDYCGNYIGIDFSPGKAGNIGQIINFGRDENKLFVISNSFTKLLELLLNQFENDNCRVLTGDNQQAYVSWKENGHFFDDLERMYNENLDKQNTDENEHPIIELDDKWKNILKKSFGSELNTRKDFEKITTLKLLNSDITNLSPLVYFKNLKELIASGLDIKDFTPISNLKDLRKLYLAKTVFCKIKVQRIATKIAECCHPVIFYFCRESALANR